MNKEKITKLLVEGDRTRALKNQASVLFLLAVVYFLIGVLEWGLDLFIACLTFAMAVVYIVIGVILLKYG